MKRSDRLTVARQAVQAKHGTEAITDAATLAARQRRDIARAAWLKRHGRKGNA